jgi:hypothetical protein
MNGAQSTGARVVQGRNGQPPICTGPKGPHASKCPVRRSGSALLSLDLSLSLVLGRTVQQELGRALPRGAPATVSGRPSESARARERRRERGQGGRTTGH